MLVSVIIINYNTFKVTCDCISSVIEYTRGVQYEIVLVDNASPDDDPKEFERKFPSIKVIASPENGGFAKGNNLGIAHSSGDIILLLNSDTKLTEDSISMAAGHLSRNTGVGALSVRLIYPDGKLQHTARRFRSIKRELLDLCRPFLKLLPYRKRAGMMLNQYFHGDYDTPADWVSGAFMMMPRELLTKLPGGKLDERFFMYGEDQLWCYQFSLLGYTSFYLSQTTVIHIHAGSTAPAKRLQLLQTFIRLELEIVKLQRGAGLYYHVFKLIFVAKEQARYLIKTLVLKLTGHNIR